MTAEKPTILLSYKHHTAPHGGGAVHGYHVVEQLGRLGYRIVTAEADTDERVEQRPRTLSGMTELLSEADAIYMRCDARPWDLALLARNRAGRRLPVLVEINAIAEAAYAFRQDLRTELSVAWMRLQYHNVVRMADAVTCISNMLAEFVTKTYPVRADRVFVVSNGGTPAAAPPRARADGSFRIAWAGGTRWPWQAVDAILDSFTRLRTAVPEAELFAYVDGDASLFAGVPGVHVQKPIHNREMPEALATMDAAVCLYRPLPRSPAGFYGSSLKLFDFMCAGLPVVASNLGQIAEVIEDGQSGFLVADDPAQVAERLRRLARDIDLRRRMGQAALQRARSGYTWNHVGDRIQGAFQILGVPLPGA